MTDDDLPDFEPGTDDLPDDLPDDPPLSTLADRLAAHLEATAERPVEREASRWLGEAQAVAADAAGADLSPPVVRERVGHVRDLLANVEGTGDDRADDHVAAARRLARAILEDD